MFIAKFEGKIITEKDGYWDDVPDDGIVMLELTLPVTVKQLNQKTGKVEDMPAPTVRLEGYDKYYFANVAQATVFKSDHGKITPGSGKGQLIKQVMAGIDERNDLVVYIEVDRRANVSVHRFPLSQFKAAVVPTALRKGIY